MRDLSTVFKFEYFNYIKSKSYKTVSAIFIILALALPCVPTVIGLTQSSGTKQAESKLAAVLDSTGLYSTEAVAVGLTGFGVESPERENAMAALASGKYAFVMEITGKAEFKLYVGKMNLAQFDLMRVAGNALRRVINMEYLASKGMTDAEISEFLGINVDGEIVTITTGDEGEGQSGDGYLRKIMYAYILLFVLYFTIILYGQYITTSIVSEKSSRTMELLITSAKPRSLIFGKVLGVGAAGMTQFFLVVASVFASFMVNSMFWPKLLFGRLGIESISELADANLSGMGGLDTIIAAIMNPIDPAVLVYLIIFFVFGFLIYAFIYAALASTASRIEEANTVSALPMILVIASFFTAMTGLSNPDTGLVVVCSYIPFMTPMVMFLRICTDSVSTAGALISIAVLIASVVAVGLLAAKIYRLGILMYGKPPKLSEIIKMLGRA